MQSSPSPITCCQSPPVPLRILWLRIFNSVLCAILTFITAGYLFRTLGLPDPYCDLGIFCIFACQMSNTQRRHT